MPAFVPNANQPVTLAPPLARTASGNGDGLDLTAFASRGDGFPPQLLVQVDATAVTGTSPTLSVVIEDSIDGVNWNSIGQTTANVTAVGRTVFAIGLRGDAYPTGYRWPFNPRRVRARWVVGGTSPNFTFSVKAVVL